MEEKSSFSLSQGIVEEFVDNELFGELRAQNLSISRGVSIVSLSEDERTISRNNSDNMIADQDGHVTVKRESSLKEDVELEESEEIPNLTLPLPRRASAARKADDSPKLNGEIKNNVAELSKDDDEDDISDPAVSNLLRRIKQQRSVLEEILNKEKEPQSVNVEAIVSESVVAQEEKILTPEKEPEILIQEEIQPKIVKKEVESPKEGT